MITGVNLILATARDADCIHRMKRQAFMPLYEIYKDDETSPAKENIEKVLRCIQKEKSCYYLITYRNSITGAVRVIEKAPGICHISPIFILPEFQNKGIGYATIQILFARFPETTIWRLETILQERRNCQLYEKCGFAVTGTQSVINEKMTLINYERKP